MSPMSSNRSTLISNYSASEAPPVSRCGFRGAGPAPISSAARLLQELRGGVVGENLATGLMRGAVVHGVLPVLHGVHGVLTRAVSVAETRLSGPIVHLGWSILAGADVIQCPLVVGGSLDRQQHRRVEPVHLFAIELGCVRERRQSGFEDDLVGEHPSEPRDDSLGPKHAVNALGVLGEDGAEFFSSHQVCLWSKAGQWFLALDLAEDRPNSRLSLGPGLGEQPCVFFAIGVKDPPGDAVARLLGLFGIRSQAPALHQVHDVHDAIIESQEEILGSSFDPDDGGTDRLICRWVECLESCEVDQLKLHESRPGKGLGHSLGVSLDLGHLGHGETLPSRSTAVSLDHKLAGLREVSRGSQIAEVVTRHAERLAVSQKNSNIATDSQVAVEKRPLCTRLPESDRDGNRSFHRQREFSIARVTMKTNGAGAELENVGLLSRVGVENLE